MSYGANVLTLQNSQGVGRYSTGYKMWFKAYEVINASRNAQIYLERKEWLFKQKEHIAMDVIDIS